MSSSLGSSLLAGLVAGVVAAIVNGLIFATGLIDQSVETPAGGPIPLSAVLIFSIVPNILGALVFWGLQQRTSAPLRTWHIIVAAVTVLSFVTILGLDGAPVSMMLALAAMHVDAGIAAYVVTPTAAERFAA